MFKLVEKIEAEEKERKDQLLKAASEEERIKLRKQHIDKKAACQKQIKELMKKHHEENEYLEQKIEEEKKAEAKKPDQEQGEAERGQEEREEMDAGQEEQDLAGEEEMKMA
jgi:peptidyl-prolyl cis-trans isomerase SDCCAG10